MKFTQNSRWLALLVALTMMAMAGTARAASTWHTYFPGSTFILPAGTSCTATTLGSTVVKPAVSCPQGGTTAVFAFEFWMPSTGSITGEQISVQTFGSSTATTGNWCNIVGYEVTPSSGIWANNAGTAGTLTTAFTPVIQTAGKDFPGPIAAVTAFNDATGLACSADCNAKHGIVSVKRGRSGTDSGCTGGEVAAAIIVEGVDVSWTGP